MAFSKSILESIRSVRAKGRIAAAIALGFIACFGSEGLWAAAPPLVVQRSTRAIPHKFTVHPDAAVVVPNQSQHFGVTDTQGRPVSVHWNLSGIGCSGIECGTIDAQGVYRPPASVPKLPYVTVEGVLDSDPNYSVLAQVRLEAVHADAKPAAEPVLTAKVQPPAAPSIERQSLAHSSEVPLPTAVSAAPTVARTNMNRSADLPLPTAVSAAPTVARANVSRSVDLPLPNAVSAAPTVAKANVSRSADLPLPTAVSAAPTVARANVNRSVDLPLPNAVSAAPTVAKANVSRSADLPLPTAVSAAPTVARANVNRSVDLPLPNAVSAAPTVETPHTVRSAELPQPKVVAAAPKVERASNGRSMELSLSTEIAAAPASVPRVATPKVIETPKVARNSESPLPNTVVSAPAGKEQRPVLTADLRPLPDLSAVSSPRVFDSKMQSLAASEGGRQNVVGSTALPPQPIAHAASASIAPGVTYRDGQLSINAENLTLADVLKLVAEKTGAVIEVPAGSGLDRIFEHAGPGPADDVLAALLNGSPFDFIIVNSQQRPHLPAQVLLSLHKADAPGVGAPPPQVAQAANPALWAAPAEVPVAANVPYDLDSNNFQPPKELPSPEALGQMMKDRAKQLREKLQPQQ